MRSLPFAGLMLIAPWLVACEELEPYLPEVRFDTMDVRDINFDRVDADFVFQVSNPNPIDIGLSSFDYRLGFEGVQLLEGGNDDGFQLEAVGDSELRLPVGLEWASVWNTLKATRGEDFVDFGLDGHFGFDTPIGEARLPYDEGGNFPALRTPKFSFRKVRVGSFDLANLSARIDVDIGVDNDHASTLFFDNFNYKLRLGGTEVATGQLATLGEVLGATEGEVSVPVNIDLLNTGSAVWSALQGGGRLNVGLDATTDVETPFGFLPLHIDETGDVDVET
jgi:LEA14-like dessication related protein